MGLFKTATIVNFFITIPRPFFMLHCRKLRRKVMARRRYAVPSYKAKSILRPVFLYSLYLMPTMSNIRLLALTASVSSYLLS